MNFQHRPLAIVSIAAFAVSIAACSSNDTASTSNTTTTAAPMTMTSSPATTGAMDEAAGPVGPGCADYAAQVPTGPGSVSGMASEPLSVAAANNPMLTTLTAAVSGQLNPQVNLVGTLDGGEFTVFAPVDSAFEKIDPATLDSLKTDSETLTAILTYHVVPGRLAPADVDGTHPTVQGATVTVTGSGDDMKVDDAAVICGGVETENATVYLIDTVLMPPA